ncbi:MAG: hypothetical protein M0P66_11525 [Salinivirgaceae bacterium]|nr:hypothetical protein [Salinivirgaceae bacterium]
MKTDRFSLCNPEDTIPSNVKGDVAVALANSPWGRKNLTEHRFGLLVIKQKAD